MATDITKLVTEGFALKREIETKQARLKEIADALVERGAGTYEDGKGASCTVVVPSAGIKPSEEDVEVCKDIAGEHFAKLFEKAVSFKPVKAFREVAAALLSKAKCAKLIAQVEKASSAFVKWAK